MSESNPPVQPRLLFFYLPTVPLRTLAGVRCCCVLCAGPVGSYLSESASDCFLCAIGAYATASGSIGIGQCNDEITVARTRACTHGGRERGREGFVRWQLARGRSLADAFPPRVRLDPLPPCPFFFPFVSPDGRVTGRGVAGRAVAVAVAWAQTFEGYSVWVLLALTGAFFAVATCCACRAQLQSELPGVFDPEPPARSREACVLRHQKQELGALVHAFHAAGADKHTLYGALLVDPHTRMVDPARVQLADLFPRWLRRQAGGRTGVQACVGVGSTQGGREAGRLGDERGREDRTRGRPCRAEARQGKRGQGEARRDKTVETGTGEG